MCVCMCVCVCMYVCMHATLVCFGQILIYGSVNRGVSIWTISCLCSCASISLCQTMTPKVPLSPRISEGNASFTHDTNTRHKHMTQTHDTNTHTTHTNTHTHTTHRGQIAVKVQHQNIDVLVPSDMSALIRVWTFVAWVNPVRSCASATTRLLSQSTTLSSMSMLTAMESY